MTVQLFFQEARGKWKILKNNEFTFSPLLPYKTYLIVLETIISASSTG